MNMQIENAKIIKDKKLNNLGDLLKDKIKSRKDPFNTISIIFPNNKVAEWFRSYWLKTEKDVLMNVKFCSLEEGLYDLLDLTNKFTLVKRHELRTLIIKQLSKLNPSEIDEVKDYIYSDEKLDSIRLFDLANSLSKLFISYECDQTSISGWQKNIYDAILKELSAKNKATFSYIWQNNKVFKDVSEAIFFGFSELDNLYCNVISDLGMHTNVLFYQIDNQLDLCLKPILMSAPSKIREIEMIHSEICKLALDNDVKYSDFLVICPDLSSYELEINKVFGQGSDKGKNNINFPNIPFCINALKQQTSFAEQAIKKLFEIASKGFYTRLDFSQLINNKMIQESRKITENDVENWTKSIIEMNVYRNGKKIDDWQYAKKRVVLSKVSNMNDVGDNIVELKSGKYIPYSNIDFDDSSICRFASMIDDLDCWINKFNKDSLADKVNLINLITELEKWFSIKDKYGHESNKIYRKYEEEINSWIYKEICSDKIPLNTLFYTLFDLSLESNGSQSNMFTRGVTFIDYEENITISSKYVFIIGLSSNEFPSKNTRSELDRRTEIKNVNDIKSFYCQCNNATNRLYLSHVNYDLKSDEEFFPSTFIIKLYEELGINLVDPKTDKIIYDKKIEIDETRPWNELFTKKEFEEKDYYFNLFKTKVKDDVCKNPNSENVINEEDIFKEKIEVDYVTVSQMKNFLVEPLKYKAERLFGYEDNIMDLLNEEYEPFLLNNLDNSILIKTVVAYILRNPDNELITSDGEVDLIITKEIFNRFILEHKIPNINSDVENNTIISVVLSAFKIVENMRKITFIAPEVQKLDDTKLKTSTKEIIFSYNGELCVHSNGISRNYIEISNSKADDYDLITMYLCSLIDIARENCDVNYEVNIYKSNKKATFTLSPKLAKEILLRIYLLMNDYNNNIYFPIKLINETLKYEEVLFDSYDNNGSWAHFKGRKLFSPSKDLGFTRDDFEQKITKTRKIIKSLILYLDKEEE